MLASQSTLITLKFQTRSYKLAAAPPAVAITRFTDRILSISLMHQVKWVNELYDKLISWDFDYVSAFIAFSYLLECAHKHTCKRKDFSTQKGYLRKTLQ